MSDRTIILNLYRTLLRSARKYPSVNRTRIYGEIRQGFRENKDQRDEKKLEMCFKEAGQALEELRRFEDNDPNSDQWNYQFK